MSREDAVRAQEQILLADECTTIGTLQNVTDCKILLDSGAAQNFMSKQYYLRNKSLKRLSKFSSNANVVQAGNGAIVNILFIIYIIILILEHMF